MAIVKSKLSVNSREAYIAYMFAIGIMDGDVQRQACLQPGSQAKSHRDQHAYSDQVFHRNPPHKANPTLVVGKKEHVRFSNLTGLSHISQGQRVHHVLPAGT